MCWWGQPEASFRLQLQDSWVPVQLRFDKQVSAWIGSINPTPSARAVDEISFLISMFVSVIRSQVRALMPVRRAEMCVVAFHPQSVSAWFPARSWGCAVSPPTEPRVLSSHLLSAFFLIAPPAILYPRWHHTDSKLLTTNRMRPPRVFGGAVVSHTHD